MARFLFTIAGTSALFIWFKVLAISLASPLRGGPGATPGWWLHALVHESYSFLGFIAAGAIVLLPSLFVIMMVVGWVRGFVAHLPLPRAISLLRVLPHR